MGDAVLTGTRRNPGLVLRFAGRDPLPRAAKLPRCRRPGLPPVSHPPTLLDWVRRLPGRRWVPDQGAWVATAVGPDPDNVLAAAGFTVDLSRGGRAGITHLSELVDPWVELATEVPERFDIGVERTESRTVIWPRLTGYERCLPLTPAAARWVADPGCWVVYTADMASVTGIRVPDHIRAIAKELHELRVAGGVDTDIQEKAAVLARSHHIDAVRDPADQLIAALGDVPDWFGFDLFGYQHSGAIAVASGHTALVDEPGLGKTAQALAAVAIRQCSRVVVVCPPVVNTNWQRETLRSRIVEHMVPVQGPRTLAPPKMASVPAPDDDILPSLDPTLATATPETGVVVIRAGRKEPDLPSAGVVIVSDSLLAARPALLSRIIGWRPDAVIVDEVHRAKSFDSARATAARAVAVAVCEGLRVAVTGTPIFSSPVDLASALAITGHLDTTFGGQSAYMETYCKRNHFNAWVAKPEMLRQLREVLEAQVWVRRTKAQVLPDLPKKLRTATFLDVDLSGFNAAHAQVIETINDWLDTFFNRYHRMPTTPGTADHGDVSEVEAWARTQVGLISGLRRAAGLAKVEAATEMIREHVQSTTEIGPNGEPVYTRPLIVWVHHREIGDAMAQAVPAAVARTRIIRGGTPAGERDRIVDDFQAGKVPVLVASIVAAGVGITLTRSCDAIFVETDWTVANVTQAEDRQCRIGQTRPVSFTTLIAPGTLDERIQGVLNTKSNLLEQLMPGGDNDPGVVAKVDKDSTVTPARIITELAVGLLAARTKRKKPRAA